VCRWVGAVSENTASWRFVCILGLWKGKEGHGRGTLYQWNCLTTCLVRSMRRVVLCGHAMCRQDKSDVDKAAVGQPHMPSPATPSDQDRLSRSSSSIYHSPQHVLQQILRAQEFNTLRLACTLFQSIHFAPGIRIRNTIPGQPRPALTQPPEPTTLWPLASGPQQPLAESSHSARTHTC
jgi:hypothetical protein